MRPLLDAGSTPRGSYRKRRGRLPHVLVALWAAAAPLPCPAAEALPNQLTPAELAEGWILLFDGQTTFGWQATSQANWQVADGAITVSSGEPGFLATTSPWGDFELQLDFRAAPETNSGVFLRTVPQPTDPARDCYELNIATPEVSPYFTGSFVGRQKAEPTRVEAGWHTFHVVAAGARWTVALDGQPVLDYTDPAPLGRGLIALQYRTGPVAFRNVKLRPRGLVPIFNGRDLAGWRPFPDKPSRFQVTSAGTLQIENGPGQLETETSYADFVLQLEVRTNGRGLNSGVFFRNLPGEFWQGYESQIHNGYLRGDRGQPADFGTGGFYRRQKARRVVADDETWVAKTVNAAGDHFAAWVNGYPVSDWTDDRPADDNPRKGLRRAAGTLALQGHDPTTDLEFRGLAIGELPPR